MKTLLLADVLNQIVSNTIFSEKKSNVISKDLHTRVAEPISTSTPQISYVVKRVNENSQNTMKEQRRGDNLFVVFTIAC